MKQRLQKCIAQATGLSRRKAEEVIAEGRVRVNGVIVSDQGTQASLLDDVIEVDGEKLKVPDQSHYILLHKPRRVVTTRSDPEGRPTVMELLPAEFQSLYPVGRLDFESEGLLLLTNDGNWANELMHPRYEVEKEYEVTVKNPLHPADQRKLTQGVRLEDGPGHFLSIRLIRDTTYSVIVGEGRNRFIRRMFSALDNEVSRLVRVRIGRLGLGSLRAGDFRALSDLEVSSLSFSQKRQR